MIDDTLDAFRQYMHKHGLNRFSYAKKAGLGVNTLRDINKPQWSPNADTIRKLEALLNG